MQYITFLIRLHNSYLIPKKNKPTRCNGTLHWHMPNTQEAEELCVLKGFQEHSEILSRNQKPKKNNNNNKPNRKTKQTSELSPNSSYISVFPGFSSSSFCL